MSVPSATSSRCVHCLQPLTAKTKDHVFPRSWYPDTTPGDVQRWTVPSCAKCNAKFGQIEQDLLLRLGLCIEPRKAAALGISEKALRSVGVRATDLPEGEKIVRSKQREKILREMIPYAEVEGSAGILPGFGPHNGFTSNNRTAILIPKASLIQVSEKVVRGLEYKRAGRYVEPPYAMRTYFVTGDPVEHIFRFGEHQHLGPGFQVVRAAAADDANVVMYRLLVWETLQMHVVIDREDMFPEHAEPDTSVHQ